MYNLNVNSSDFNQRTKSVFDTLANLEASHKFKQTEYLDDQKPEGVDETELTNEWDTEHNKEPVFKVPSIPKRSISDSKDFKQSKRVKPDHLVNPDKWKKYDLSDVKEMSTGANYSAAMSFFNSKNIITEEEEEEIDVKIVFNKPIGKGKKSSQLELVDEEEFIKEDLSKELKSDVLFIKKKNRKSQRKPILNDEEDEDEKKSENLIVNNDIELNDIADDDEIDQDSETEVDFVNHLA